MPRNPLLFLLLLLAIAACGGGDRVHASAQSIAAVSLEASARELVVGEKLQLTARALDLHNAPIPDVRFTWTSSDPEVAPVGAEGLLVAKSPGLVTVRAGAGAYTGEISVRVKYAKVARVVIEPGHLDLEVGRSRTLRASAWDEGAMRLEGRAARWSSDAPGRISVDQGGTITALSHGEATIRATIDGVEAIAVVRGVEAAVARIELDTTRVSLELGQMAQLVATAWDQDGNRLDREVGWESSDPRVAEVGFSGTVFTRGAGTATITALYGDARATALVEVKESPVATVIVEADARRLRVGSVLQLTAIARDRAGRVLGTRPVEWRVDPAGHALLVGAGAIVGKSEGSARIEATVGGVTGGTSIDVYDQVVRVEVTPPLSDRLVGNDVQLQARAFGLDGTELVRTLVWSSSDPAVVSVTSAGLATIRAGGTATISASTEGIAGSASVHGTEIHFTQVVAAGNSTCALDDGGAPWCWGNSVTEPTPLSTSLRFVQLALGLGHMCGLTAAGEAWCSGDNHAGQLGIGSTVAVSGFVQVAGGRTFTQLVAGGDCSCGLDPSGAAFCWGANDTWQLGTGDDLERYEPVPVAGGHSFARLWTGSGTRYEGATCGISAAGEAWCWGLMILGNGATEASAVPALVPNASGWSDVRPTFVRTGGTNGPATGHACGLDGAGLASCWGINLYGNFGNGESFGGSLTPVPVAGGHVFASIYTSAVAGNAFSCGRKASGAVWCWGGYGSAAVVNSTVPVQVPGGLSFTALALGGNHLCGLDIRNKLYCWGANLAGQLGTGTTVLESAPTLVRGQTP